MVHIQKLQTYVTDNQVSVFDRKEIDQRVSDQQILYLRIYLQGFLIYDSGYSDQNVTSESGISYHDMNGEMEK